MIRTHFFFACILVLVWITGAPAHADTPETLIIQSSGAEHRFQVEIADTPDARARGLMFRTRLAPDAGMLFIYETPRQISMWMKNTYIALDMLFLDQTGEVVTIAQNTEPHSLTPISSTQSAIMVLEVRAGTVARLGIRRGDTVSRLSDD